MPCLVGLSLNVLQSLPIILLGTEVPIIIPWLHPIILELCLTPHDKILYCDWLPAYTQSLKTLDSIKCLADQLDGMRYSFACVLLRARLLSLDHIAALLLFDLLHMVTERTTYPDHVVWEQNLCGFPPIIPALCSVQRGTRNYAFRLGASLMSISCVSPPKRLNLMLSCVVPPQDGMTSLHLASQEGHTKIAQLLIQRGANVLAKDEVFIWWLINWFHEFPVLCWYG